MFIKFRDIIEVRADIKMIFKYSVINNNVNKTLEYSVLNPDTNSDSPSTRSNGARFSSASSVISQNKNIIIFIIGRNSVDLEKELEILKSGVNNIILIIRIAILTS